MDIEAEIHGLRNAIRDGEDEIAAEIGCRLGAHVLTTLERIASALEAIALKGTQP